MEDSSKVLFNRFEEGDAEGIQSIYPQFFEDCPQLKSEEGFFVAEMNGRIVGFFVVVTQMTYPWWDKYVKSWCEIVELHVHHKFWRKDIGTQLVRKAIDYAKSKGVEAIYVITGEENVPARKLYEKCGFKEQQRRIRYKKSVMLE